MVRNSGGSSSPEASPSQRRPSRKQGHGRHGLRLAGTDDPAFLWAQPDTSEGQSRTVVVGEHLWDWSESVGAGSFAALLKQESGALRRWGRGVSGELSGQRLIGVAGEHFTLCSSRDC